MCYWVVTYEREAEREDGVDQCVLTLSDFLVGIFEELGEIAVEPRDVAEGASQVVVRHGSLAIQGSVSVALDCHSGISDQVTLRVVRSPRGDGLNTTTFGCPTKSHKSCD
ncbi:MAG: hypothetical protein H0U53_00225 [Actinobacteria bacterium]|nr:hypothetical protein [Actinomycetota bacterium]